MVKQKATTFSQKLQNRLSIQSCSQNCHKTITNKTLTKTKVLYLHRYFLMTLPFFIRNTTFNEWVYEVIITCKFSNVY